nr:helix-turn-helix domain containing protein [Bacillus subtilis]
MFYDSEIRLFRELWAANESYLNIAKELKRNEDETLFLIIDQAKKDLIEPRESGLLGKEASEDERNKQKLPF